MLFSPPWHTEFALGCLVFRLSANRFLNISSWMAMSFLMIVFACFYSSSCFSISFYRVPVLLSSSAFYASAIYMLFFIRFRSIGVSSGGLWANIVFARRIWALLGSGNPPVPYTCDFTISLPVSGLILRALVLSLMPFSSFFFFFFSLARVNCLFSLSIIPPICLFSFDNLSI